MFSGIVSGMGLVTATGGGHLVVESRALDRTLRAGDSVAVNGVCLTVADLPAGGFVADVMPETERRTTLGSLRPGDALNLERGLALGDPVGGHLVAGHVDAVGTITLLREDGNARWATIDVPPELSPLIAEKGCVAVDGISLTVVDALRASFTVSLIPHTLAHTTAGSWSAGSRVNVEADLIARYVQRLLGAALPTMPAGVVSREG
jgi:riboflavin synthase